MKIYTGHGTPLWLSLRRGGGLIVMQGQNRLLLSSEELPQFLDAVYAMTGITADPMTVTATLD